MKETTPAAMPQDEKDGVNGLMMCLLIKLKKESLGILHGGLLGESERKNLF